jgi:site-specific DNA-methyltransferase (adenine-specific)
MDDLDFTTGKVLVGDCLARLKDLDDASIDSIVTDPPYHLTSIVKRFSSDTAAPAKSNGQTGVYARASAGFMGQKWDGGDIAYNVDLWRECLRVLKPGGHLLAFGGTRTYHRMAVAIEDAGFEIRDSLHWVYGSGFPKSLNVAKAITATETTGGSAPQNLRKARQGTAYKPTGQADYRAGRAFGDAGPDDDTPTELTVNARQWSGWGTALKPAHEPIVVARKPLVGTVAGNVLAHGTGALNIDGTRVGSEERTYTPRLTSNENLNDDGWSKIGEPAAPVAATGRWPANLVFTHAADCGDECADGCPVAELDGQGDGASRFFTVTEWDPTADVAPFRYVAKPSKAERNAGLDGLPVATAGGMTDRKDGSAGLNSPRAGAGRTSGAANTHPTVKPVALMRWLVRLVTPPGGTVLDPFLGSGTTAVAAELEGFKWVGCELTTDYLPIIRGRVKWAKGERKAGRQDKPRFKAPASKPKAGSAPDKQPASEQGAGQTQLPLADQ